MKTARQGAANNLVNSYKADLGQCRHEREQLLIRLDLWEANKSRISKDLQDKTIARIHDDIALLNVEEVQTIEKIAKLSCIYLFD